MNAEQTLCSTVVEEPGPDDRELPEPGASFGRYEILERLGAGGMGVVFAARDRRLDRKLALKVLRRRGHASDARRAREHSMLLREAQALARLHHPNVVLIHDVGSIDGRVFLAMELIEGRTLRAWKAEHEPDIEEILAVFRQAGAGLAAAHEAGLVHRDFKPDNVMISAGEVRVLDFGLAREAGAVAPGDVPAGAAGPPSPTTPGTLLTRTGTLRGTPAYMSPEQYEGGTVDARSDQFSFCVALWEALVGERPFEAESMDELRAAMAAGRLRRVPPGRVPPSLIRALRRGLAYAPEERWPSMQALLDELRLPARWGGARFVALAVAVLAAGLAIGRHAVPDSERAPQATSDSSADEDQSP